MYKGGEMEVMKISWQKWHLFVLLWVSFYTICEHRSPRLTIVFVVDQLSYCHMQKLNNHFTGGIKSLLDDGIVYTNAYYPHAMPATATGHAALNTGVFAKDHGIIGNSWFDVEGNRINCDDDAASSAAVFAQEGLYDYGKSAHRCMVDGISDQFILQSKPRAQYKVFGLSLKSRSAIATANKLGKAIWFDEGTGRFTSSKAYFKELPAWLTQFNKEHGVDKLTDLLWTPFYNKSSAAYAFANIKNYDFATNNAPSLIGRRMSREQFGNESENDTYAVKGFNDIFQHTPHANKLIFELAKSCIRSNFNAKKNDRLLVWINLSSLDKVGHVYGPESMEAIDTIYHLDNQIKNFMQFVRKKVKPVDLLYAFTADHGVEPIPELLNQRGLQSAHRVIYKDIIQKMNRLIQENYGIADIVANIKVPQVFLREDKMAILEHDKQEKIITELKNFLVSQPGIKNVWTFSELSKACMQPYEIESFYKNQLYPGRSGRLTFQLFPFTLFTKYAGGAAHRTPYEQNTHVPLILYQKGRLENKKLYQRVWTLQFANTLAQLLGISKPSSSTFELLPSIFDR